MTLSKRSKQMGRFEGFQTRGAEGHSYVKGITSAPPSGRGGAKALRRGRGVGGLMRHRPWTPGRKGPALFPASVL